MIPWLVPLFVFMLGSHPLWNTRAVAFALRSDRHPLNRIVRHFSKASHPPLAMSKRDSPSAQRNKQPIWEILATKVLPVMKTTDKDDQKLRILEVAAGCGVHTEYFALKMNELFDDGKSFTWYPTDPMADSLESIQCYINDNADPLSNIVAPPMFLTLDASGIQEESTKTTVSSSHLDLIICINMIHISPREATLGLMKVAGECLVEKGCLYCYGPYKVGGTAVESNLNFDTSLKSRDPSWGVRDFEAVLEAASQQGLELIDKIEMPANNLSLIFQRKAKN